MYPYICLLIAPTSNGIKTTQDFKCLRCCEYCFYNRSSLPSGRTTLGDFRNAPTSRGRKSWFEGMGLMFAELCYIKDCRWGSYRLRASASRSHDRFKHLPIWNSGTFSVHKKWRHHTPCVKPGKSGIDKSTERSKIPACPSFMWFSNRGNTEGTDSSKNVYVLCRYEHVWGYFL